MVTHEEGESLTDAMWRFAHDRNMFKPKGYRAKKASHLQALRQARQLCSMWAITTFETLFVTIEADAIKQGLLPRIRFRCASAASDSVGMDGTTSSKVLTIDDKAIRSCGVNALAMGVAVLTDDRNRRVLT